MTYEDIAKLNNLNPTTEKRFVEYMRMRWADSEDTKCQVGYASEWAERFKNGYEYRASDSIGLAVLAVIDNKGF